jgi:superfamily II DNA or RNA helicase
MGFELRPYQSSALAALDHYWMNGGGNPLISMATGTGKALVIAWLIRDVLTKYQDLRLLIASHVQEILDQDIQHLLELWPDAKPLIGLNCDALGRRDWDHPILFASIASIFRSPKKLGRRNLTLVDECHLIPHTGDGMYRSTFAAIREGYPEMRVAGFSATCWRLDTGRLDEGEGKIFDEVVFDYGIGQAIKDGWLAPLTSKATSTKLDVSKVGPEVASISNPNCNVRSTPSLLLRRPAMRLWLPALTANLGSYFAPALPTVNTFAMPSAQEGSRRKPCSARRRSMNANRSPPTSRPARSGH